MGLVDSVEYSLGGTISQGALGSPSQSDTQLGLGFCRAVALTAWILDQQPQPCLGAY